jgi:hypothetical protein
MKRFVELVSVVLLSVSIGGCVSAKQRAEEQQALEKSIRSTSDPDAVKGCSDIMNLRPDGIHATPEAQAASLVIPKQGVSWVILDTPRGHELYSCSQKSNPDQQQAKALTPTPVDGKPGGETSTPVEAKAPPASPEARPEVVTSGRPEAKIEPPAPATKSAARTRITNNPEAVKGCKFLESFAQYQKVSSFQEDVVRAGGNLGYIVATNRDGDVIGESYLCSDER